MYPNAKNNDSRIPIEENANESKPFTKKSPIAKRRKIDNRPPAILSEDFMICNEYTGIMFSFHIFDINS